MEGDIGKRMASEAIEHEATLAAKAEKDRVDAQILLGADLAIVSKLFSRLQEEITGYNSTAPSVLLKADVKDRTITIYREQKPAVELTVLGSSLVLTSVSGFPLDIPIEYAIYGSETNPEFFDRTTGIPGYTKPVPLDDVIEKALKRAAIRDLG